MLSVPRNKSNRNVRRRHPSCFAPSHTYTPHVEACLCNTHTGQRVQTLWRAAEPPVMHVRRSCSLSRPSFWYVLYVHSTLHHIYTWISVVHTTYTQIYFPFLLVAFLPLDETRDVESQLGSLQDAQQRTSGLSVIKGPGGYAMGRTPCMYVSILSIYISMVHICAVLHQPTTGQSISAAYRRMDCHTPPLPPPILPFRVTRAVPN